MTHVSECRSCSAPILWVRTQAGKNMPVDAEPSSAGVYVLSGLDTPKPDAVRLANDTAATYTGDKYQSHFETCPQANQWSKGRKAKP